MQTNLSRTQVDLAKLKYIIVFLLIMIFVTFFFFLGFGNNEKKGVSEESFGNSFEDSSSYNAMNSMPETKGSMVEKGSVSLFAKQEGEEWQSTLGNEIADENFRNRQNLKEYRAKNGEGDLYYKEKPARIERSSSVSYSPPSGYKKPVRNRKNKGSELNYENFVKEKRETEIAYESKKDVSVLPRFVLDDPRDALDPEPKKGRFYGVSNSRNKKAISFTTKKNEGERLVQIVTAESKTVINGSDLKFLIKEDFEVNGLYFSKGSLISGICQINTGRVSVNFSSIIKNGSMYPLSGVLYDVDGYAGINYYTEDDLDLRKQLASQGTSSALSQINPLIVYNPNGDIGQQISTQVVGSLVNQALNAGQQVVQRKISKNKVNIVTGHVCFLNISVGH